MGSCGDNSDTYLLLINPEILFYVRLYPQSEFLNLSSSSLHSFASSSLLCLLCDEAIDGVAHSRHVGVVALVPACSSGVPSED